MLLKSEPISEDLGYLLLRLGFGGSLLWQHGWPKLMHFSERLEGFPDPIGLGPAVSLVLILIAEVLCAALVVLGLWTRLAAIPPMIGMAVIAFVVHGDGTFGDREMPLLYLIAFAVLFLTGSGRFAIDRISFK